MSLRDLVETSRRFGPFFFVGVLCCGVGYYCRWLWHRLWNGVT